MNNFEYQNLDSQANTETCRRDCFSVRAFGKDVTWIKDNGETRIKLKKNVVARMHIDPNDDWKSNRPLYLVENSIVFRDMSWCINRKKGATIMYCRGHLSKTLIKWLKNKRRASSIVFFYDYDGAGLRNFSRLYKEIGKNYYCVMMKISDIEEKIKKYGNEEIWLKTQGLLPKNNDLPPHARKIKRLLTSFNLALEQEAIFLT